MEQRRKVLVAHSDPDLLIVLEHFLEDAGFDATTTWDGQKAMSLIESQRFQAAVLGGRPRSVCCTEILTKLRIDRRDTVCIMLANSDRMVVGDLQRMGVHAIISKWNLKEVVNTLQRITSTTQSSAMSDSRSDVA